MVEVRMDMEPTREDACFAVLQVIHAEVTATAKCTPAAVSKTSIDTGTRAITNTCQEIQHQCWIFGQNIRKIRLVLVLWALQIEKKRVRAEESEFGGFQCVVIHVCYEASPGIVSIPLL